MKKLSFPEAIKEILREDHRFAADAYIFLQEALAFTVKYLARPPKGQGQHVRGPELLDGIRRYALQEYGAMSKTILNAWGVTRCEDFGDIVFHLVHKGVLRKTDEDRIEDFAGGYDFDTAFRGPFRPRSARAGSMSPGLAEPPAGPTPAV
jgi:uncharacterized repeat protein (TIGR04138 family)